MTHSNNLASALPPVLIGLACLHAPAAHADAEPKTPDPVEVSDKSLRIVDERAEDALKVSFQPTKSVFAVGEPITFDIRANKEVFLYLIAKDDTDRRVLLLPNAVDAMNKYPAGRTLKVPNAKVSFRADEAGTEEVIMVASTTALEVDRSRYAKSGDFISMTESEADTALKGIRVVNEKEKQRVVKKLSVKVVHPRRPGIRLGRGRTAEAPASAEGTVLVKTDKSRYASGSEGVLIYVSTQKGKLQLKLRNPDGSETALTDAPIDVEADKVYRKKFVAQAPFGEQAIIAELVPTKKKGADTAAKGIRLVDDAAPIRDEHIFTVVR